jgi:response regulator of citrate/malate metabolism
MALERRRKRLEREQETKRKLQEQKKQQQHELDALNVSVKNDEPKQNQKSFEIDSHVLGLFNQNVE